MSDTNSGITHLKVKNERLKLWLGLIALIVTNVVTLATALTAHQRANNETKATAAYIELSNAMSELSKDNIRLHNDVENLRGYLAGLAARGSLDTPPKLPEPKKKPYQYFPKPKPTASGQPPPEPPIISQKPVPYEPPPVGNL